MLGVQCGEKEARDAGSKIVAESIGFIFIEKAGSILNRAQTVLNKRGDLRVLTTVARKVQQLPPYRPS